MKIFKQLVKIFPSIPRYIMLTLFLALIAGIFLRFVNIYEFINFLGDQGRDAIIIKRIVTLEHFPAIGAPSSVGSVFLGPFYYYFIAPWLLISGFDPVGLAIGVATFSVIFLIAVFVIVRRITNTSVAAVSMVLMTFSSVMVDLSRFSWNPNLLPFSALITAFFTYRALKNRKIIDFFLVGIFFGISTQLHYIALALALPIIIHIITSWILLKEKPTEKIKRIIAEAGTGLLGFILMSLPLILFDMKHQFLNVKNFIAVFAGGEDVSSNGLLNVAETFHRLNELALYDAIPKWASFSLLLIIGGAWVYSYIKKDGVSFFISFFMFTLLVTSFYTGHKHVHYFVAVYTFYYISLAYLLTLFFQKKWLTPIALLIVIFFIGLQSKNYHFLYTEGSNQIWRSKEVAKVIYDNVSAEKFQVTGLPDDYGDSTYRYFIELWGKRALEKDSLERADELFVMCQDDCSPIGDPQWDIAFFEPTKIVGKWRKADVTIIKLIR